MQARKMIWVSLLTAGLALAGTGGAMAADVAHSHDGHGSTQLELNHGKKWATDDPLRKGMGNMRATMVGALSAIHDDKLNAAGYRALADRIETEMAYVVANCKLDPAADMQLHLVLAQLGDGVTKMKSPDSAASRKEGAVTTVQSLNAYGEHFDHPGWKALTHR
ncbi:MAG TPA: hypothetical protein VIQ01_03920 [Burkholderiales bacterium]